MLSQCWPPARDSCTCEGFVSELTYSLKHSLKMAISSGLNCLAYYSKCQLVSESGRGPSIRWTLGTERRKKKGKGGSVLPFWYQGWLRGGGEEKEGEREKEKNKRQRLKKKGRSCQLDANMNFGLMWTNGAPSGFKCRYSTVACTKQCVVERRISSSRSRCLSVRAIKNETNGWMDGGENEG